MEGVNFLPKKFGSRKELMESHQELFNKGKDMSWILRILDGTILFSAVISVSGMTWKKKKKHEMGMSFH